MSTFDYSTCKIATDSLVGPYVKGDCITNTDPVNDYEKSKLIKTLELNSPKTFIISKDGLTNKILYVLYSKEMPSSSSSFLPYDSTNPFQIIYKYFIITITTEDVYRFEAYYVSDIKTTTFYINGIPLESKLTLSGSYANKRIEANAKLSAGDYFVCFETRSSDIKNNMVGSCAIQDMRNIAYRNDFTVPSLTPYVIKSVNFYTQANSKYADTLGTVCTPDNYLSSDYCKELIKSGNTLNETVLSKCMTNVNGTLVFSGDDTCSDVIENVLNKSTNVNTNLSTDIYKAVEKWFTSKLGSSANLGSMTIEELTKLNYLFDKLKTYNGFIPSLDKLSTRTEIAKYCESKAGDVFSIANDNSLCGKIYNDTSLVNYNNPQLTNNTALATEIGNSKEKLKLNYCYTPQSDGKYRFQSDPLCAEEIKTNNFLNDKIMERCTYAGVAPFEEQYCYDLIKQNINSETITGEKPATNTDLRLKLRKAANDFAIKETKNISPTTQRNGQLLNGKLISEDYITNWYAKLADRNETDLLNDNYLDYCFSNDSKLDKSSCGPLYKAFSSNNNIIKNRAKMRNKNCMSEDRLITNLNTEESKDKNENNCFDLANGNLHNQYTFQNAMNSFCTKPENVVKPECNQYYQTAPSKFLKNLANNTAVSAFGNKEGFEDGVAKAHSEIAYAESAINFKFILYILLVLVIVCVFVYFLSTRIKNKSNFINKQI